MPDHDKLSNQLKSLRAHAELTQAQLAVKARVSRKTINTVENGVFIPSTILALRLARALNVNVEDIFQLPD
ncbi:helix-turn-helix transcriptional regulator [Robiginitomaculum antarcticum]|uniref:helix-turn-helix transcriptional regulator n=1 Tax=Robiginitomaculum antarcticum TaxID=437507 RepID=UPI0003710C6C|nr:helix-turn-helix transcriptional regulator [Robiginitomaculum antarcticum]